MPLAPAAPAIIDVPALASLIPLLDRRGYKVIGPIVRDAAVVYDAVEKLEDLPAGWTDEQEAGRYRLIRTDSPELFGFTVQAQSCKQYLHPADVRVFEGEREGNAFRIIPPELITTKYAFLGVRSCDLAAIAVQDRVFMQDRYLERGYNVRRSKAIIIAANCTHASRTCFCKSMETGPRATSGYDLCLTELIGDGRHVFLVETGTQAGADILAELEHTEATDADMAAAEAAVRGAENQTRSVETDGLKELLYESFEHSRWEKTAHRCFACGNCTLVCPTCFCTTMDDSTNIGGTHAERWRRWDSCFNEQFSYIHGGSVRLSGRSRYRQWITHKLGSWVDQFGTFGCIGCGRCITWCPAKIDITEEVAAVSGVEGRNG